MYQRMIQACLENQIGKTVEAYVDGMVIKTKNVDQLVDDLRSTFDYELTIYGSTGTNASLGSPSDNC